MFTDNKKYIELKKQIIKHKCHQIIDGYLYYVTYDEYCDICWKIGVTPVDLDQEYIYKYYNVIISN